MDRDLESRLARIEGKINAIARGLAFVLGIGVGFAAFFVTREYGWAPYFAFGAGFVAAFGLERSMVAMEKWLPHSNDDRT